MGPELMARFREQAERFGAEIVTEKATRVDLSARPFEIWTDDPEATDPEGRPWPTLQYDRRTAVGVLASDLRGAATA